MLLSELLELYTAKRLKACSHNTLRLYRHSISSFAKSLCRTPELSDLTDDNIERHMWSLVHSGGSPASANKDHGQLTALWRFASHNRIIDTWPNVRPLPERERVPMGWMPDELDRLFAAIEREGGMIGDVPAKIWWQTLINILLDTGERIGAIRYLEKQHVQGDYLLVPAHLRKGRKRDKLYKIGEQTTQGVLYLVGNAKGELLFPWDRCESYIYNRYTAILKRARLSHDARSKFHRLRRTCASAVKKLGGDPTFAMDHASPRTTRRYLDPRIVGEDATSDFIKRYRQID
jgi:integrase